MVNYAILLLYFCQRNSVLLIVPAKIKKETETKKKCENIRKKTVRSMINKNPPNRWIGKCRRVRYSF